MSKTKSQLEAEVKELRDTWIPPHRYEELVVNLHNREEQLETVKMARGHLEVENDELRQQTKGLRRRARQDQEQLTRLELTLEQLIPDEYLGDNWDSLVEPARLFIEHLLANQAESTITVPITLEVKVRNGHDRS